MKSRFLKSIKEQREDILKRSKKVLIIDDEANIRESCKQFFEKFGINVDTAVSAEEAFKLCDKNIYALVFLDINLKDAISGFELLEILKKKYSSTKLVMMSEYATIEQELKAIENGAAGFLPKPFDLQGLRAIVNKLL
ncbi:response regulator [bacterium]|nr:response regulator [bacterium]MBU3929532.1 response regulator [bacterium]